MRLIDADELKKRMCNECLVGKCALRCYEWHLMDDAPTVEPKHGHWDNKIIEFDVPHTVARCSNCKGKIWIYAENYVVKYPYCPLCGCKMDEVTNETD